MSEDRRDRMGLRPEHAFVVQFGPATRVMPNQDQLVCERGEQA
jgi:hypothetical protein